MMPLSLQIVFLLRQTLDMSHYDVKMNKDKLLVTRMQQTA